MKAIPHNLCGIAFYQSTSKAVASVIFSTASKISEPFKLLCRQINLCGIRADKAVL